MFTPPPVFTATELMSAIVRDPLVAAPHTLVIAAIAQMSAVRTVCATSFAINRAMDHRHLEARSSCVLVVDDDRLVGIVTERDVVQLIAQRRSLGDVTLQDVMTHPVISLREADFTDLFFALNLLQQRHIRHLPLLDACDRPVGLLTSESLRQISGHVALLRLRRVDEVMTTSVVCAAATASMQEIARLMAEHRVSSVVVTSPQPQTLLQPQTSLCSCSPPTPLGLVTERDIVQLAALNFDLDTYPVEVFMGALPGSVRRQDSLWRVQHLMETHLVRQLVVTGDHGELVGLVTQSTLLQMFNPGELYKLADALEQQVLQLEAEKIELLENRTVELETQVAERTVTLLAKTERERLISQIANRIRTSLDLQDILTTCVQEVRGFLGCDRVLVYQLQPDGSGIPVAESVGAGWRPSLGDRITDHCFSPQASRDYTQGKTVVVNDIYASGYADCHIHLLERYQVKSNLVVPILVSEHLWGLLIGHQCADFRVWQVDAVTLLDEMAVQLAIAIQQSVAYQQLQTELDERKQAEARLQESEQRYATLAAAAPVGIFRTDDQGNSLYINQRGIEILGLASAHPSSRRWLESLHPDDAETVQAELDACRRDNRPFQHEYRLQYPDGTVIWVYGQMVAERNTAGQITGYVGTITDISDRKQAEAERLQTQKLRLELTLLENILDTILAGYWDADLVNGKQYISPGFKRMFGYEDHELPNSPETWKSIVFSEDLPKAIAGYTQHVESHGKIPYYNELRYHHKNGSTVWVICTGRVIEWDAAGNPLRLIGCHIDITDRKQAEQTIRQQAEREVLLREITQRIRQSLDLQTIFETACQEVRQSIQADRVGIFKFYPESHFDDGEFVAEALVPGFSSVMLTKVHDHCFGERYAPLYAQGRIQVLEDVQAGDLLECHTGVLAQFQVRANLIVPLLNGGTLWGLLCVHQCSGPRKWQDADVNLTQQIANQLAIAIQQASLYGQVQSELMIRQQAEQAIALQLQRQQAFGAISEQIRDALDVESILATVTRQVKALVKADRVIIFQLFADGKSRIVEESVDPAYSALKEQQWEDESFGQEILDCYLQGRPRIVADTMTDHWTQCLQEYTIAGQIQSKVVVPILLEEGELQQGRWVDPGEHTQLWGLMCVHACGDRRIWEESEALLLQQIANHLAISIQRVNLFQQIQQELSERQQAEARLTESNYQLAISNEQLARATRLKDEFLANMSHELRTPLNAILGMTEGLDDGVFGDLNPQQHDALQTIDRSGTHLLELINDILDLAKIEAGQIELSRTLTPIGELCQSSLTFIRQQAVKKRLQLQLHVQFELPDLLLDERRMRQVLINLLNNAVKFTPEGGCITLGVTLESRTDLGGNGQCVRFAVTDTGIGIAPADLKKLFQPFIQVDSALNRHYEGTGLGLSLVKRIVELHGGQVGVTSEVGVGSCFTLDLPYSLSTVPGCSPLPSRLEVEVVPVATESVAPLILLAEDNEANRLTISSYLKAKGYRLLMANNGEEAIALTQSHSPDLILMDIQMPGMDGIESMQQIRQQVSVENLPIIALTSLAMVGDRERCLEAGANDYLTKPVKLKQLVTIIQQFLRPPAANR